MGGATIRRLLRLAAGSRLGPYEILAPLGAGGMGEVYRARDTRLARDVALEVLPAHVAQDGDTLARFEREAHAAAALSHPNILAIFDFGTSDGIAYAVTELLDGETLRERLKAGALTPRKVAEYAAQVAHGLSAAHDKGIVHRDLKPENLYLTREGRVKILDFGLARQSQMGAFGSNSGSPTEAHTEPGTLLGTVSYMSPEQVRGKAVDHRSDIFSLGAVLYEMATGVRAFQRDTPAETMSTILRDDPLDSTDGATRSGRLTPGLDRVLRHCLEKNPDERFQSARDLAFDLEALTRSHTSGQPALAGQLVHRPSGRNSIGIYELDSQRYSDLDVEGSGVVAWLNGDRSLLFPHRSRLMSLDVAPRRVRAVEVPVGTSGGRASDWIGGIGLPDQRTLFVQRTRGNGEIWQMTLPGR